MKNQMTQFVMFALNYDQNFITEVWGKGSNISNHIQGIWNNMEDRNSYALMVKFWTLLSNSNRDMLSKYIAERY